jgi:ribA/ribD-fused uncharacterized protein
MSEGQILKRVKGKIWRRIDRFQSEYKFLSNFSPSGVYHDGIEYPTVEHAFQAAKTLDFQRRREISQLASPADAKQAGRRLELRPDWEKCKDWIMLELVLHKFARDFELRQELLATGDAELIEGNNWHDSYWGECTCGACPRPGKNMLGQILSTVRLMLR